MKTSKMNSLKNSTAKMFKALSLLAVVNLVIPVSQVEAGQCEFYHGETGLMFAVRAANSELECLQIPVPKHSHFGNIAPRSHDGETKTASSQRLPTTHSHSDAHSHSMVLSKDSPNKENSKKLKIKPRPITIMSTHTVIYIDEDGE